MITLIIVNCQNDFITGTMSTKGAKSYVENIKNFIKDNEIEIDKIIFSLEWHPYNHTSFKNYGGNLQHHCVQYTPGSCIEPKLLKLVHSLEINYECSLRGDMEEIDEIGAFNEIEFVQDSFGSRYYFDSVVTVDADSEFVICGIAENVKATIENMIFEGIVPKVYIQGIINLDKSFTDFIKANKLEKWIL